MDKRRGPIDIQAYAADPHTVIYPSRLQLWDGPDLYTLTRERRAEQAAKRPTLRVGSIYDHHRALETWETHITLFTPVSAVDVPGFIANDALTGMFNFQFGCCYICNRPFTATLPATKEHVKPRAKGGKNPGNILLACAPCNNSKGDKTPTPHQRRMLDAYNKRDGTRWCALVRKGNIT